ncbi:MAG TPA: PQQ-binding-like beta-propeller repeat protein [Candidatus Polarisedimenticolaceae bacterium]|nr:PQQ-binding-like beta-propeller repeat protein [Candidatus Polarisedimenticolaceae bacterium]
MGPDRADRFGIATLALLALGLVSTATADDWPQWRGPERDGRSAETGLLDNWPAGGPPLEWRASGLGSGFSSVAVAGERIYTLGDSGDAQYAVALDRKDGKQLWKTRVGPAWDDEYLGPRSTPTVDGKRIFVLSTEGDLFAIDAESGVTVWQRNLVKDFGGAMMKAMGQYEWKYSESPLVDGDRVVVTPGGKEAMMVALAKATGEEIWRVAIPSLGEKGTDGAGYSSPVVSEAGGVRQYVQFVGRGVIGVEAKTGRFLWGYNKVANDVANIPTPLVDGDRVFASSGYGTGSALIELSRGDGGFSAREVYFLGPDTMQNHHGGLILHDGHVYAGSGHNKGLPVSVELATGKVAWGPERNDGQASAAIAYADGRLYFRYQNGLMVLVEATPEGYREHGSFTIPDVKRPSWPHPVIAGGKLYLREQDHLYCYDVRARG